MQHRIITGFYNKVFNDIAGILSSVVFYFYASGIAFFEYSVGIVSGN